MTTDEIYAAAISKFWDDVDDLDEDVLEAALKAALDAVAPLLIARGRREAARDIRRGVATGQEMPGDLKPRHGSRPTTTAMGEWAARIAEGPVDGPSVAVAPRTAPDGPGARTDAEVATGDGGT